MHSVGAVSLVGAGPGDPDLMTVRGLERLSKADVVIYDRLTHPRLLDHAPVHAERIFAGKASGAPSMEQRTIERLMIDHARAGNHVVRLKGGDPFVFGRGGEEAEALVDAGIPYEVVPGLSSAIAVPASAGIPVTHRECASSVTIVTGHEDPNKPHSCVDWEWLAAGTGTLVVLMGLERLEAICSRLIQGGRSPWTPAAVIASGTLPQQRSVTAPLIELVEAARDAALRSPAIIVIGDVVQVAERIASGSLDAVAQAV